MKQLIKLKNALILPFVKPGEDPANANNYRPIALTSHLSIWTEKIIVYRLSYFLETRVASEKKDQQQMPEFK